MAMVRQVKLWKTFFSISQIKESKKNPKGKVTQTNP